MQVQLICRSDKDPEEKAQLEKSFNAYRLSYYFEKKDAATTNKVHE